MLAVIDRLSRQYPRISVHLVTGSRRLCGELIERKIELVIIRIAKPIFDQQLVVENFSMIHLWWRRGSQNPWTRRRRIQLAELVNEPWVLLPFDSPPGPSWRRHFVQAESSRREQRCSPIRSTCATGYSRPAAFFRHPALFIDLPGRPASIKALPVELPGTRRPMGSSH